MQSYHYTFLFFWCMFSSVVQAEQLTIVAIINNSQHSIYIDQYDWKLGTQLEENIPDHFIPYMEVSSPSSFQLPSYQNPIKTKHIYLTSQNIHPVYIKTKTKFFKLLLANPTFSYQDNIKTISVCLCFQNIVSDDALIQTMQTFTLANPENQLDVPTTFTAQVIIIIDEDEELHARMIEN